MGDDTFFDKVYRTTGTREIAALYDDWASVYDADLDAAGYATPARIAAALAQVAPGAMDQPVLDYGCGTGLAGLALRAAGFQTIDGCDPSPPMLEKTAALGVYRQTFTFDPLHPPGPDILRGYPLITASGVVSVGAAPPEVLPHLFACLGPDACLAFSYNAHTLADAAYMKALAEVLDSPACALLFSEDGPHLPKLGSISRVIVVRRQ